jgi:hypothetical protein
MGGGGGGGQGTGNGSGSGGGGGFGGCGGGSNSSVGGTGGFGGGNGGSGGGGGGLGAGGAIFAFRAALTLVNSTLNLNTAHDGGANSNGLGGAIFNCNGSLTIENSTLAGNQAIGGAATGGAIYNLTYGNGPIPASLVLKNTILADSTAAADLCNNQISGTASVDLSSPNLLQGLQNLGGTLIGQPAFTSDPQLGALMDNGGLTPTMQPGPASVVYGAGDPTVCSDALVSGVDQRGQERGPGTCSLGAYDLGALGAACTSAGGCRSGFCTDGVCCNTDCGGNNPSNCESCSQAMGASSDGTCSLLPAGVVCRPSVDEFDPAEMCTGSDAMCPPDVNDITLTRASGGGISCSQRPGKVDSGAAAALAALLVLMFLWRRDVRTGRARTARPRAHKN